MGLKNIMSGALKMALPSLAGALPLPPPIGTMAAAKVASILGVDKLAAEQVPDAITAAQAKDPDILLKLKQGDRDFASSLEQLGVDVAKLAIEDTRDARAREIAIRDKTPRNLAYIIVAAALGMEGYTLFHGVAQGLDPVITGRILGTLDALALTAVGYFLGTSLSSARKTEQDHELKLLEK